GGETAGRVRELARGLQSLESVVEAIAGRDERQDGSGGPGGRAGDEIPLLGRILALAREIERLPPPAGGEVGGGGEAEGFLVRVGELAAGRFDPDVVQAFLVAHRNGGLPGPAVAPG
ncbi:MAG: HD domain-containing phosphohydrolase, partial [Candidatus Methylomirabilales bacterium]